MESWFRQPYGMPAYNGRYDSLHWTIKHLKLSIECMCLRSLPLLMCAPVIVLSACTGQHKGSLPTTDAPVDISATDCPALSDNRSAQISHEVYLKAHATSAVETTVWLRSARNAELFRCSSTENCAERDASIDAVAELNQQEISCVFQEGLGQRDLQATTRHVDILADYWDEPLRRSDGRIVPILKAFELPVTLELAQRLATHPYVARLEPAVGRVSSFYGVVAPPLPSDCPTGREAPGPKLTESAELRGAGRKPVAIKLREQGYLPEQKPCDDGSTNCDMWTNAEWERYILNRRQLTCVQRGLDGVVGNDDSDVSYLVVTGNPLTRPLPLLETLPSEVVEFGRALTWEEAQAIAGRPEIEAIRLLDQSAMPAVDNCPIDTTAPIPAPDCNGVRESSEGKWSTTDESFWIAANMPSNVTVQVVGGHTVCPRSDCPPDPSPCPEFDEWQKYLEEWNWRSQRCVRTLIEELGGSASDERFWIVDSIVATLTWSQIQEVGKHPAVKHIGRASGGG